MQTPSQEIQEIYIGLLGRAADKSGLDYWAEELAAGKITIDQIRENFVNQQPEYARDFGHLSRGQVVRELYQRMFDREAEPTGLEYWVNGDGKAVDIDRLVLALGNGAGDEDRTILDNKIEGAEYYTNNVVSYHLETARLVVKMIGKDVTTIENAKLYTDEVGVVFELTSGVDNFGGSDKKDTFVAYPSNTLSAGDVLDGGANNDGIIIVDPAEGFNGAKIQNIEDFLFREWNGSVAGVYDFASVDGEARVVYEPSESSFSVLNLASGVEIILGGIGDQVDAVLNFSMQNRLDPIILRFKDVHLIGSEVNVKSVNGAPTMATLYSSDSDLNTTGLIDLVSGTGSLTTLIINADSGLKLNHSADDYAGGAEIIISGKAYEVKFESPVSDAVIKVDASGLSLGGFTGTLGANTVSFIGGERWDNVTLSSKASQAGPVMIDLGNGSDDISLTAEALNGGRKVTVKLGGGYDLVKREATQGESNVTYEIETATSVNSDLHAMYGFQMNDGTYKGDLIDFENMTILDSTAGVSGQAVGDVKSHSISNGIISFSNQTVFSNAAENLIVMDVQSVLDAKTYIKENFEPSGSTAAFYYAKESDQKPDSMFVFNLAEELTSIILVGTQASSLVTGSSIAADSILVG